MRILYLILLLLLCAVPSVAQTLTATSRGTGQNAVAAANITITPGTNLAAGSMGVLVIAMDNTGSGGNTPASPVTETDSVGNVWYRRLNIIYDPGAANAGVEVSFYTAYLSTALTTSNNLVFDFVSVQPPSKAWTLTEIVPPVGYRVSFVNGACDDVCGAASAAPSVTTSSITNKDVVIGGGGSESSLTWTGDADTTNGSWANEQEVGAGSGATGIAVTSQIKIVTATATQQYDPTLTSADQVIGWIQVRGMPLVRPTSVF